MVWLKAIHIAAIAIWSAGLICLPGLHVQRAHVAEDTSLHRLHRLVRFLYIAMMSPAAFIAIGTGTALIFLRETWAPWMGLKLVFVGLMTTTHILTGLVVSRLFDPGQVYAPWRYVAVTAFTLLIVSAILIVVLAKPDLPPLLPAWMYEPRGLRRLFGLNPSA